MRKKPQRRSDCPISFALDTFGDKWSLLILRDLLFSGKSSYGEFLNSEEGIATNILADRLQILEHAGIITKAQDPTVKTKIIYSLTEKGIDLLPKLIEIILWSAKYDPKTATPRRLVTQGRKDREKLMKQIRDGLKRKIALFPKK